DRGYNIAVDGLGAAYVTGISSSADFPTLNDSQPDYHGGTDAFVTKLSPGGILVYSTYLGGSGLEDGRAVAVDGAGAAYIAGFTKSADFPTAAPVQASLQGAQDAFVTKLDASGVLAYSTYLGGTGFDFEYSIAVDGAGMAYVTGSTDSVDFPTLSAFQPT